MRGLSFLIFGFVFSLSVFAQPSPHGDQLQFECIECHTTESWEVNLLTITFDHSTTSYSLLGEHEQIDCKLCHMSLNFNDEKGKADCASCHLDVHQQTLGNDCEACHTENTWIINDVSEIHFNSRFPLVDVHANADCFDCHLSENLLQFRPIGIECIDCHREEYLATTSPIHTARDFSTDCLDCHNMGVDDWSLARFNSDLHEYFPLTGVHDIDDCLACHTADSYEQSSHDCESCHIEDYNATIDPPHAALNFPVDCSECHLTEVDWPMVSFTIHNDFYVLEGAHASIANDCALCHTDGYIGAPNTCYECHTEDYSNTSLPSHSAVNFSTECMDCHSQTAWEPSTFIHDENYVLEGAHTSLATECAICHVNGYTNTPNTCYECHTEDYNGVVDPSHLTLNLSTDCSECHSQNTWESATFDIHNDFYVLEGAHTAIANECAECHTSGYINTPNTCNGCHAEDYNGVADPSHIISNFSTECMDCHTQTAWLPSTFNHDDVYVFEGAHASIANECALCHTEDYSNTPNTCFECHTDEYNQEVDPPHLSSNFPTDCSECHSQNSWESATFDMHNDFYLLEGAHASIANECALCHIDGYINMPTTCYGCHADDYNQSENPSHIALNFSTECTDCHSQIAWVPSTFYHDDIYVLEGAHASIANECALCHDGDYVNTPNTCYGCHAEDFNTTSEPSHIDANFSLECIDCHSQTAWEPSTFNHDDVFVLEGIHSTFANECALCHEGDYANTPNTCYGCHAEDYHGTTDPNHVLADFPTECTECHTQDTWITGNFNHDDIYILEGAHAMIANECSLCHEGGYSNAPNTCFGCHAEDYNGAVEPSHTASNISTECTDCHSQTEWTPSTFNHDDVFVLEGAHASIVNECILCHQGDFTSTPNTCYGCHEDDYNSTTNNNHEISNLTLECSECHTQTAWYPSIFDHDNFYVLEGVHSTLINDNECAYCHTGSALPTTSCYGCHSDDYKGVADPSHLLANFAVNCKECHTQTAWSPMTFNHSEVFVLEGAHASIADECNLCHVGPTPSNTCMGCHTEEYNGAADPSHIVGNFASYECADCHSQYTWDPSIFNHNDFYVLEGAHISSVNECALCHTGEYSSTTDDCYACHAGDFLPADDLAHEIASFTNECADCHSQTNWTSSTFDHDNFYLLEGAHIAVANDNDCALCHIGYTSTPPNTCYECHSTDYAGADPLHDVAYFSTDCTECHSQNIWSSGTFDIHNDYYVLEGAHAAIANDCAECHTGNYSSTPNTCFGCHESDFTPSDDLAHDIASFFNECAECHSQIGWAPSTFDHNNYFVLEGAHITLVNNDECTLCHTSTALPSTDCYDCHATDYNGTTDPAHLAGNFPTDCTVCHNQNAWTPSDFDHDALYFPIYIGHHSDDWTSCADCHTDPSNYAIFDCLGCHDQTETDIIHSGIGRYVYNSTYCLDCHPAGIR